MTRLPQVLLGRLRERAVAVTTATTTEISTVAAHADAALKPLANFRCCVALSGGRDSTALLHAMADLRAATGVHVAAIHVHHGLSPNADAWAAHCQEFCKLLNVPLSVQHVRVDRLSGQGLEAAARAARYAVFCEVDADLLLLGHHAGDQAETLLFNLLRGAGLRGASGMPALRTLRGQGVGALYLLRPWLGQTGEQIDDYCRHYRLSYVVDESNDDPGFSRNFIRHLVLPPLAARFPGAVERLAAAARRLAEAQQLTDDLADLDLQTVIVAGRVEVSALHALSAPRQRNVLRRWLSLRFARPGEIALDELRRQMRDAASDAQVSMAFDGLQLHLWRGGLYAVPASSAEEQSPVDCAWPVVGSLAWAGQQLRFEIVTGRGLRLPTGGRVQLRLRQGGERIRLRATGPSQTVKSLLQDAGVPPWDRKRLPCVWFDGQLVAIPGVGVAAGHTAGPGQAGVDISIVPASNGTSSIERFEALSEFDR